jgi:tRNA(Ile)-lysidine synthase
LCHQWNVPLVIVRVQAAHVSGESPEDAARQARYQAFHQALQSNWGGAVQHIALGQHADDQVETLLLALSRGAGLPGLASMPAVVMRQGVTYHRPWLHEAGATLRQALKDMGQPWVEDPTNQDTRYTRNKIRADILPALGVAFPSFRQTFARSAAHAAQAQSLLQELAEQDLLQVGNPPNIQALQQLSEARQTNVLAPLVGAREHASQCGPNGGLIGASEIVHHPRSRHPHQGRAGLCEARGGSLALLQLKAFLQNHTNYFCNVFDCS